MATLLIIGGAWFVVAFFLALFLGAMIRAGRGNIDHPAW